MKLTKNQKAILALTSIFAVSAVVVAWVYRKNILNVGKSAFKASSDFKNKLVQNVLAEYKKWNQGNTKEGDPSTMDNLRNYWATVGWANRSDHTKINTPWSAAFISHVMEKSGSGADFKKSASHSTYIVDSIKNRKNNTGVFKGYKPDEVKIEVGDLIGRPRQNGVTYDTTGNYASHTDIVVEVTPNEAKMIGGNVGNSVTMTKVPLENGKIAVSKRQTASKPKNYHVVIKNLK